MGKRPGQPHSILGISFINYSGEVVKGRLRCLGNMNIVQITYGNMLCGFLPVIRSRQGPYNLVYFFMN